MAAREVLERRAHGVYRIRSMPLQRALRVHGSSWDALDIPDDARFPYAEARGRIIEFVTRIAEA